MRSASQVCRADQDEHPTRCGVHPTRCGCSSCCAACRAACRAPLHRTAPLDARRGGRRRGGVLPAVRGAGRVRGVHAVRAVKVLGALPRAHVQRARAQGARPQAVRACAPAAPPAALPLRTLAASALAFEHGKEVVRSGACAVLPEKQSAGLARAGASEPAVPGQCCRSSWWCTCGARASRTWSSSATPSAPCWSWPQARPQGARALSQEPVESAAPAG
jgi:hypothetical protein